MGKITEMPFPTETVMELRVTELHLLEQVLLEKKWKLENLAAKKLATTEQQIDLHHTTQLINRLFKIRFNHHYRSMRKYYEAKNHERKTTDRLARDIGYPMPSIKKGE